MKNKSILKILAMIMSLLMLASVFAACSNKGKTDETTASDTTAAAGNEDTAAEDTTEENGGASESGINTMPLADIMDLIYAGISEDELPMLSRTEITADTAESYFGTSDIEFTEGLASEPLMSSIAHSVCLIRVADGADKDAIVQKIKDNVNPAKWICVMVEDKFVNVEQNGNVIALIMVNDTAPTLAAAFLAIK